MAAKRSHNGYADHVEVAPWYTNAYVLLTIIVSVVAIAFASLLLLLLFVLPWSSEIIRYMQGKMLTVQSANVDLSVKYTGMAAVKGTDGVYAAKDESFTWHSVGAIDLRDRAVPKSRESFTLTEGVSPVREFAGDHVRDGVVDYLRFNKLPEHLGVLDFTPYKDKWLRVQRQRLLDLTSLPLVGSGHNPMTELDAVALAEQFRKTPFFEVAERLPDETFSGAVAHHYKVRTDPGNLRFENFFEKVEAARLGRALTDAEQAKAKTLFSNFVLKDCDLWIGTRDYFLYRAVFSLRIDDGIRRGDADVDVLFTDFNGVPVIDPAGADPQDITPILLSLLAGARSHLPMAAAGTQQHIDTSVNGGTGLPVNLQTEADADPDADSLGNYLETFYRTDPHNPDTDGDGVKDGDEIQNGCNPGGSGKLFDFGITNDKGNCK